MQPAATRQIDSLLALPRSAKKLLAVMADSALCVLTVWLAICFRFESWVSLSDYQWLAVLLSVVLAIPLLTSFGFYHTVIRYVGRQTITAALRAIGIYTVIFGAVFTAYGFPLVPRTIGILQPLLLLISLAFIRLFASQLLTTQTIRSELIEHGHAVLIYGAGHSGQQLAASLITRSQSRVVGFLDDNANLYKASISGIPVYNPEDLEQLIKRKNVHSVLLAMPSLTRSRRNEIIQFLSLTRLAVRTLPSLNDLATGKANENDLRAINIEDLLGRDPVDPIQELMCKNISGKIVVVTGAGGSIGSELSRQILRFNPRQLVLIDLNEYALYNIQEEMQLLNVGTQTCQLTPILANVLDHARLVQLFEKIRPNTIYHAAAYKHVPLVEVNPVAGLKNNVLGTLNVAQAALSCNVDDMVLISTDKAVRPTNIMGASKRLAEMTIQSLAAERISTSNSTRFCMVRFGNVLGSSGSVIPKFQQQIQNGGPISLTHPDITRYFMTIPEAAQLVIQAGAINDSHKLGAQVFLLDMGESVKIFNLAKTLIQLNGFTLLDESNPAGDIAIKITGLRPGEKLYEELLIEGKPSLTCHPKIWLAQDQRMSMGSTYKGWIDWIESLTDNASNAHIASELTKFNTHYAEIRELR
jgi:FlaA1/EpsC-like NDP-sugar epimerase